MNRIQECSILDLGHTIPKMKKIGDNLLFNLHIFIYNSNNLNFFLFLESWMVRYIYYEES